MRQPQPLFGAGPVKNVSQRENLAPTTIKLALTLAKKGCYDNRALNLVYSPLSRSLTVIAVTRLQWLIVC